MSKYIYASKMIVILLVLILCLFVMFYEPKCSITGITGGGNRMIVIKYEDFFDKTVTIYGEAHDNLDKKLPKRLLRKIKNDPSTALLVELPPDKKDAYRSNNIIDRSMDYFSNTYRKSKLKNFIGIDNRYIEEYKKYRYGAELTESDSRASQIEKYLSLVRNHKALTKLSRELQEKINNCIDEYVQVLLESGCNVLKPLMAFMLDIELITILMADGSYKNIIIYIGAEHLRSIYVLMQLLFSKKPDVIEDNYGFDDLKTTEISLNSLYLCKKP